MIAALMPAPNAENLSIASAIAVPALEPMAFVTSAVNMTPM